MIGRFIFHPKKSFLTSTYQAFFKPCAISTLTSEQKYQPHTSRYVQLQQKSLEKDFSKEAVSIVQLKKGHRVLGSTVNYEVVYGAIPVYDSEISPLIQQELELTSGHIEIYSLNEAINCLRVEMQNGSIRYYIHPEKLSINELDNHFSLSKK